VLAIVGGVLLLSIDRRLGAAGFGLLVVAFTLHGSRKPEAGSRKPEAGSLFRR
jgi:hypothetical protein